MQNAYLCFRFSLCGLMICFFKISIDVCEPVCVFQNTKTYFHHGRCITGSSKYHISFLKRKSIYFVKHKSRFQNANTGFQNFTILQSVYVQRRKHICISKRKQGFLKNLNPDFKTQIQVFKSLLFYNPGTCKGGNTFVFQNANRNFSRT